MTAAIRPTHPPTTLSAKSETPPDQPTGPKPDRSLDQLEVKGQTPPDENSGEKSDRGVI